MAVSTDNAFSGPYLTNGVTTVFPFTFTAPSADEVGVILRDALGVDAQATGYTVSLVNGGGGSVAFSVAPTAGYSLLVLLEPAFTQDIAFENGSAWRAEPVNEGYDRSAARDQALKRDVDRGLKAPVGEAGFTLPAASARADKALFFAEDGTPDTISIDDFAAPANEAAARSEAYSGVLASVNNGYFEPEINPPPADAAEGQTYFVATTDGREILARNEGGVGVVVFERATLTAVGDELRPLKTAPVTDKFITNLDGAVINRLGDRVFAGGANKNNGNYPNNNIADQDWYTAYERAQGRPDGIIVSSQMAVLTNDYFGAAVAGVFAARTSTLGPTVGGAVGLEAHVVNDNATVAHDAWALYSEATRDSEGVGAIITYEADSRNKGNYHAITPYAQHPKQSVVHQVASGGALDGTGCEDVSAGINFRHNPTKFGAGIVFGSESIRGTDGVTGYGNAILSALGHRFTWTNAAGQRTGWITTTATTTGAASGIEFSEIGTLFLGPSDTVLARVRSVINAVNYLDFVAGTTGGSAQILATGSDANVALFFSGKGSGAIAMSPDSVRNYVDDAAAASGGVPVGGLYHASGDLKIRIA